LGWKTRKHYNWTEVTEGLCGHTDTINLLN